MNGSKELNAPGITDMIDFELTQALERHFKDRNGPTPTRLADSIKYSLLAPGKRIRPRLLLTASEMLGVNPKAALPAALAIEMIHCFTLIHDDLPCMDNDDFRRGRPSNHKQFDESTALLAGDALIALAFDSLLDGSPHIDPTCLLEAVRTLTWAAGPRGVIGGQAAESELGSHSSLKELQSMHARKTGALFSAALLIARDLAGLAPKCDQGKVIAHFAAELGLAFQVVDDIEDAQDLAKNEGTSPVNILKYQSLEEARSTTLQRLLSSMQEITDHWPRTSQPLLAIASEVVSKLKTI